MREASRLCVCLAGVFSLYVLVYLLMCIQVPVRGVELVRVFDLSLSESYSWAESDLCAHAVQRVELEILSVWDKYAQWGDVNTTWT